MKWSMFKPTVVFNKLSDGWSKVGYRPRNGWSTHIQVMNQSTSASRSIAALAVDEQTRCTAQHVTAHLLVPFFFWEKQLGSSHSTQPLPQTHASSMRERNRITTSSSAFWSMRNFNSLPGDRNWTSPQVVGDHLNTRSKWNLPKGTVQILHATNIVIKKQNGKLWSCCLLHPAKWWSLNPEIEFGDLSICSLMSR